MVRTDFLYNVAFFWIQSLGPQMDEFDAGGLAALAFLSSPLSLYDPSFHLFVPSPPAMFYSFYFPSMPSGCMLPINLSFCLPAGVSDRHS